MAIDQADSTCSCVESSPLLTHVQAPPTSPRHPSVWRLWSSCVRCSWHVQSITAQPFLQRGSCSRGGLAEAADLVRTVHRLLLFEIATERLSSLHSRDLHSQHTGRLHVFTAFVSNQVTQTHTSTAVRLRWSSLGTCPVWAGGRCVV